jgi:hypothetical protein
VKRIIERKEVQEVKRKKKESERGGVILLELSKINGCLQ